MNPSFPCRRARACAAAVVWCGIALMGLGGVSPSRADNPSRVDAADWTYLIAKGDTLIGMSNEYLVRPADWPRLQRLNRIADPLRLVPGSEVRIPIAWLRQTATVAEAVFVRGDVTLQRNSEVVAAVQTGASLRAGDVLRTAAQSSLTLRFADGSRLLVVPDSEVSIVQLLAVGRAARPVLRMRLDRGSADAQVAPRPARDTRFEIRTPAVNLGVRGTEFRARVDPQRGTTRVEVLDGRVLAAPAEARRGGGLLVGAGLGVVAEAGQPLSPPLRLIGPPDLSGVAEVVERLPLKLSWAALPGATGYRAQVLAADSSDQLLLDGVFTEPAARWSDLPDGRYRLRARALSEQALEGRDASSTFVLNARPEPPFTRAPADGATVYGATGELQWARSTVAAKYRLQVADTPGFQNLRLDIDDITSTVRPLALPPGTYHWRVASIAVDGDIGPFGDAQSFTLKPLPASPVLAPAQPDANGLLLRWQSPGADRKVRFQIATDAAFAAIVQDETTDAVQTLLKDPSPGTYFLRARTIEADGFEGPFGAVQQVEVPASPWWLLVPGGLMLLLL